MGPVPADTVFVPHTSKHCDCVIAMYHDQGLPVLKHASFGHGVNVTLGLPIVRTSVDHGTALDLAADGAGARSADPGSMVAAVSLAIELAARAGACQRRRMNAGPARWTGQRIARRRFGQNFLVDRHYVDRIVAAIAPQAGDNMVEIGPGLGALTRSLIEAGGHLTVIEIDRDLAARLMSGIPASDSHAAHRDALAFDFASWERRPARDRQPAVQHLDAAAVPPRPLCRVRCATLS